MGNRLAEQYSRFISAEDYVQTVWKQHLYIEEANRYALQWIANFAQLGPCTLLEIGCGPGVLLDELAAIPMVQVFALDKDSEFLQYARAHNSGPIHFIEQDLFSYQHPTPINVCYSSGLHHHIAKGRPTQEYLSRVWKQLAPNGYYIVVDEFIPDYQSQEERDIRLVIWYAHIIHHALVNRYHKLAEEEAKTLLDDIAEGYIEVGLKTQQQLQLILQNVAAIAVDAHRVDSLMAFERAKELRQKLLATFAKTAQTEKALAGSRHDFKISGRHFQEEVHAAHFSIEEEKSFGPIGTSGALVVYVLKKIESK